MQFRENFSLKSYNTFGVEAKCRSFAEVQTDDELIQLISSLTHDNSPYMLLGGGSNILFTSDYDGTVIKIATLGKTVVSETAEEIFIKAAAGENWDAFVASCVENGWGGLENLSLIPGNVGTGPVQNIGAYGAEIKDVISEVEAFDIGLLQKRIFSQAECDFSYRSSIFKITPTAFIILNVTFHLSKKPLLNLGYSDIHDELKSMGVTTPDLRSVRDAVCSIRRRKLPDPAKIGNSGSFYKNPVITKEHLLLLKEKHPDIVSFPYRDDVKLAAAWMIDQCGWKGYRKGDAGVHERQPLVLVNYGNATGGEILSLAREIQDDIQKKFGIWLETEVNIC
jgi:UDP-N-acetylmuramate dehydrogenase